MRRLVFVLIALAPLAACGPIPLPQAEEACFQQARLATQPRGEIGFGVDSKGNVGANAEVTITSDFIQGRDPAQVYESCVYQRSGQPPSRPLYERPDWKG
ncbi:MAG: hypothetical protein RLZZ528_2904 [Pseudomonadota bacterium]|jgi:predicted small lipoprotein YifL